MMYLLLSINAYLGAFIFNILVIYLPAWTGKWVKLQYNVERGDNFED